MLLPLVAALLTYTPLTRAQWDGDYRHGDYRHGDYRHGDYRHGDYRHGACCGWRCLLFTLQWPGSFCQSLDDETLCKILPNINNWTIHGLWPYKAHNCCQCWPMFHSDIEDFETELSESWPSLLKTKTDFQFWRQEWLKHGVCAACVEGLNSAQKYFQTCLRLRARFDIHRLLDAAGITPSCNRTYKVDDVRRVVAPLFGNPHEIQCVTDNQDRELWFQLKISLFPNLTTGCGHTYHTGGPEPPHTHPCPPQLPLYYLPIDHRQPPRPCH